jgi:hypothetical protein
MGTAETRQEADLWDDAGTFWYRHLPPSTVASLFSGECDLLTVREEDGFWLSRTGEMGSSPFATLEEAKRAGDAVIDGAWCCMGGRISRDAGLSPSVWSFSYGEAPSFTFLDDASLTVVANPDTGDASGQWAAWNGDAVVGDYAEPAQAAEALIRRPAPGL